MNFFRRSKHRRRDSRICRSFCGRIYFGSDQFLGLRFFGDGCAMFCRSCDLFLVWNWQADYLIHFFFFIFWLIFFYSVLLFFFIFFFLFAIFLQFFFSFFANWKKKFFGNEMKKISHQFFSFFFFLWSILMIKIH